MSKPNIFDVLKVANKVWLALVGVLFFATLSSAQNKTQSDASHLDLLIRDVTLVDVLNKQVVPRQTIGIKNGHIVFLANNPSGLQSKIVIDGSRYVALPGFINTHTHLWQHICKACYPKEKLQQWVRVYRTVHYLNPDELYDVSLAASSEALLSGITSVSDYASLSFNDYGFEANARALRDAGLGGVLVWSNPSVFLPDSLKLEEIQHLRTAYQSRFDIWMGFGGLSFYSLPQVYSGIRIAEKLGMHTTEHTMENIQEQRDLYDNFKNYYDLYKDKLSKSDREMLEKALTLKRPASVDAFEQIRRDADRALKIDQSQGRLSPEQKKVLEQLKSERIISPLPVLDYLKALPHCLAIHSVWQQQEDIEIMRKNSVAVSHNPESNLYLSSGIAPVNDYLNSDILVTLGTDGAASNDGINFFSAMREMWNVYKLDLMNTDVSRTFDEWNILQAATINGARALMLDDRTGSLTVGKEADVVLISNDELGMSPIRLDKLVPLLIYSANTRNVKYVISDGEIVVQNGHLIKNDEKELATRLSSIAVAVDKRIASGKTWREDYDISGQSPYWYRFRSVRELDTVNLKIRNAALFPMKVTVMSSGMTFGGGSCYVVDKEVNDRFPENCPKDAFKEELVLEPGQRAQITKEPKHWEFGIATPSQTLSKKSNSGQLLIVVTRK